MQLNGERKVKLITILVVSIAFLLAIIVFFQFLRLGNLTSKKHSLEKSYSELEQSIETYSKELEYYQDREQYLKDYAHQYLNWSRDNEIIYSAN